METLATRACKSCGLEFPATTEHFSVKGGSRGGLHTECKACRAAAARRWRADHPRPRRVLLSDEEKAHRRHAYYLQTRDRHREQMRDWRKNNALAIRLSTARYRARKRSAGGTHSPEDVMRQLSAQAGLCYWCGSRLGDGYEVDHFFPVSRGGSNDASNIVVACMGCNRAKHAKTPEDFLWQLIDTNGTRPWHTPAAQS